MKFGRNLIIVALATFCLTATLFTIRPTLSNTSAIGQYDAWNDLNGDGVIDMYDAINFAGTFNTAGDPTKNVNVTNLPLDEQGNLKVSEQKILQNYTEGMTFNVLDTGRIVNGTEFGIYVVSCGGFFSFAPKQNFLGVTKLGVVIEVFTATGNHTYNYNYTVQINYHDAVADWFEIIDYYPTSRCTWADPTWIKPGVNLIGLQFYESIFVLKLDVYVEYQYQA